MKAFRDISLDMTDTKWLKIIDLAVCRFKEESSLAVEIETSRAERKMSSQLTKFTKVKEQDAKAKGEHYRL